LPIISESGVSFMDVYQFSFKRIVSTNWASIWQVHTNITPARKPMKAQNHRSPVGRLSLACFGDS
jgi:hypothetical protein